MGCIAAVPDAQLVLDEVIEPVGQLEVTIFSSGGNNGIIIFVCCNVGMGHNCLGARLSCAPSSVFEISYSPERKFKRQILAVSFR